MWTVCIVPTQSGIWRSQGLLQAFSATCAAHGWKGFQSLPVSFSIVVFHVYIVMPLEPPSGHSLVLYCHHEGGSVVTLGDCAVMEGGAGIAPVRLNLILLPLL